MICEYLPCGLHLCGCINCHVACIRRWPIGVYACTNTMNIGGGGSVGAISCILTLYYGVIALLCVLGCVLEHTRLLQTWKSDLEICLRPMWLHQVETCVHLSFIHHVSFSCTITHYCCKSMNLADWLTVKTWLHSPRFYGKAQACTARAAQQGSCCHHAHWQPDTRQTMGQLWDGQMVHFEPIG